MLWHSSSFVQLEEESLMNKDFLAGVASTLTAVACIKIFRLAWGWLSGRGRETYGLSHALLSLEVSSLWLNMGFWRDTQNYRKACEVSIPA